MWRTEGEVSVVSVHDPTDGYVNANRPLISFIVHTR